MEDARETWGLNLKALFSRYPQLWRTSEVGPGPLSAEQTGRARCWSPAWETNATGRGGTGRAHGNPDRPLHPARPHSRPTGSTGGDTVRR